MGRCIYQLPVTLNRLMCLIDSMMNKDHELSLLKRARSFDLQALAEIYDTYSPALYAYAMRLLGDPQAAEDCVADTFSRLLQALKAGKGPTDYLQAYLYRIAHNWVTDQYRRQPARESESLDGALLISSSNPEGEAAERIQRAQVRSALRSLTPEQRQVVTLRFIEGWENEEVALALQKPVGAVKALQHRAIKALKQILLKGYESYYETT